VRRSCLSGADYCSSTVPCAGHCGAGVCVCTAACTCTVCQWLWWYEVSHTLQVLAVGADATCCLCPAPGTTSVDDLGAQLMSGLSLAGPGRQARPAAPPAASAAPAIDLRNSATSTPHAPAARPQQPGQGSRTGPSHDVVDLTSPGGTPEVQQKQKQAQPTSSSSAQGSGGRKFGHGLVQRSQASGGAKPAGSGSPSGLVKEEQQSVQQEQEQEQEGQREQQQESCSFVSAHSDDGASWKQEEASPGTSAGNWAAARDLPLPGSSPTGQGASSVTSGMPAGTAGGSPTPGGSPAAAVASPLPEQEAVQRRMQQEQQQAAAEAERLRAEEAEVRRRQQAAAAAARAAAAEAEAEAAEKVKAAQARAAAEAAAEEADAAGRQAREAELQQEQEQGQQQDEQQETWQEAEEGAEVPMPSLKELKAEKRAIKTALRQLEVDIEQAKAAGDKAVVKQVRRAGFLLARLHNPAAVVCQLLDACMQALVTV
jgi:hypothetical protein